MPYLFMRASLIVSIWALSTSSLLIIAESNNFFIISTVSSIKVASVLLFEDNMLKKWYGLSFLRVFFQNIYEHIF